MFELVMCPGSARQERIRFAVSEANLDDAIDYGRVSADDPLDRQVRDCAYHMVLELDVCRSAERITEEPWVLLRNGRIIARNALAADIDEDDLE